MVTSKLFVTLSSQRPTRFAGAFAFFWNTDEGESIYSPSTPRTKRSKFTHGPPPQEE